MRSSANSVGEYLAELATDRRKPIEAVREVVRSRIPKGYVEAINWGMIAYEVPLTINPKTYNGKPLLYAAIANQKNHMAVYLCSINCVPGMRQAFESKLTKVGKMFDMGKACFRFRRLEDIDLNLIGDVIASTSVEDFIKAAQR